MSVQEDNKALIRHYFEEVWNKGNLDLLDRIMVPEYVTHSKVFVPTLRDAFPDLHITLDDLIAEGNKVVVGFTSRGTHQGDLNKEKMGWLPFSVPATGKPVEYKGLFIYIIVDGIIQRDGHWGLTDALGMLRQVDAIPSSS